ncbi:NADH-quinone oxidoreductase subunit L [Candidatus Profftia lariciata]|uniref:NADH-quinone oxidoreductase subunit L n=1 Tax=Candidatus Profftia lariciata TaxID=1987921 RepID=UPI001D020D53|nr:NADH-quinone oxidoreductase subunit L [Candidatus Profftia lariciata]UDG81652.1 NADH-quinone oxidoreductase subunit L [Candidatus Profftia lariciata]
MNLLYLTIMLPLTGFLFLAFSRGRWSEKISAIIGINSVGLAALVVIYVGFDFFNNTSISTRIFYQHLWNWITIDSMSIPITLMIDQLSFSMISIVIGVGFFIHIFASWYMLGQEGYSRFFAYTNLFIASMLVLVLANNLLLMYLGWEGVGLCSYLLIGFYYANPINGAAAMKAFIITRIGDVCLAIGLFLIYKELGTLNIHELITLAPQKLEVGSATIIWSTVMLLIGAISKSAQIPLHTWLADAMAGPTPVSALIHAATMVTAGVYLITRMHGLFAMSPVILHLVGIIGVTTLVVAGFAALVQTNIKRVLAYSTMSQIGYMFLALSVQAWNAAIFHLMTHACFKGLLFLSSGSVILCCNHEQNIFKMGGLRKSLPFIYVCFLVGGASLSALPICTAGFYSKDAILWKVMVSGDINLITISLFGALLTSLYIFRMIFIVFHGKEYTTIHIRKLGMAHNLPLIVLLVLSTFIGSLLIQPLINILPETHNSNIGKINLEIISGIFAIIGILLAAALWLSKCKFLNSVIHDITSKWLLNLLFHAGGFDWIYNIIFIKPFKISAYLLQHDPLNYLTNLLVMFTGWGNKFFAFSENGQLRWYIASISLGTTIILSLLLLIK